MTVSRTNGTSSRGIVARLQSMAFAAPIYGVVLLGTLIPAVVALLRAGGWSAPVQILAIVISLGSAIAVYCSATAKNFSLASCVFWVWTYVFLGLAQLYQLAADVFPWKGHYTAGTVLMVQSIIVVGCVTLAIASTFVVRRKRSLAYLAIGVALPPPNVSRLRLFAIVLLTAYVVIAVAFVLITGGSLFEGKAALQHQLVQDSNIPGAGSLFFISTAGAIVVPAFAIVLRRNGVRVPLGLVILVTVCAAVVTNPLTGSRFLVGTFLIALTGALLARTAILRLMPAGIASALVTVFPSLDLFRGDGTGSSALAFALPHQTLISFDFDSFEMLLREAGVAGHIPANLPSALDLFVAPFVRWIPVISDRVHGFSSGSVVGKSTGMTYTNVSMPLWGEAHLTGGFVGLIAAFAALGVLLGLIRQPVLGAVAFRARPSRLSIDAPVAALLFIVLRGSLYEVLDYLIFAVILGFVAWLIARSGTLGVMLADADFQNTELRPRTVAFYLPQFHAIPQNDEWWGAGFTEWRNVAKATPLFDGHDHPRRVGELDEYDLTEVQVMHSQADLARDADIDAFCFYFYWFGGTRLLEKPLDNYLERGPDFPFCISWANESWTRRWDGKEKESLIAQEYSSTTANDVFDSFIPYLTDPRYLRVDGAAVIVVHRADHLPTRQNFGQIWRQRAKELGIGELHLIAAETNSGIDPRVLKFDAVSEFPPVGSNTLNAARLRPPKGLASGFRGRLMSYPRLARSFMRRPESQFVRYRGVAPSWDNSARRHENATIYADSSPYEYKKWLTHARAYESSERGSNGLVFVNAWNEWAEGAYLEPDVTNGRMYLEATKVTGGQATPRPPRPLSGPVTVAWIRSLILATAGSAIKMMRDTRRSFSIFTRR